MSSGSRTATGGPRSAGRAAAGRPRVTNFVDLRAAISWENLERRGVGSAPRGPDNVGRHAAQDVLQDWGGVPDHRHAALRAALLGIGISAACPEEEPQWTAALPPEGSRSGAADQASAL